MDRRRYSALVASGLTLAVSGCTGDDGGTGGDAGNESAGDANGDDSDGSDSDETTDGNETNDSSSEEETESETQPPNFEVTIDAPERVETGEEWTYTIRVANSGGAGEFQTSLSVKLGDTEWEQRYSNITANVDAGETEVVQESDNLYYPTPFTLKIRADSADVVSTTEIVWGDPYDPDNIRDLASTVDYDELFRNFEEYQGEAVHFEFGRIYQSIYPENEEYPTAGDYYQLQVSNDAESFQGDIAADWYRDQRLLENDSIELWGVAEQLFSYETVDGNTRTIPRITMTDVVIRE